MDSDTIIDSLLIYEVNNNLINIGDYIQSLAARQFINEPIQLLSREKLDIYSGRMTRLIMNGWFLHQTEHWPPSKNIDPLFISFHINSSALNIIRDKGSLEYFRKHQPIGCRDKYTVDLLAENGVQSYFSGCLTLTLGETYSSKEKEDKVYFVDPYIPDLSDLSYLKKILFLISSFPNLFQILKIGKKKYSENFSIRKYLKASIFYKIYKPFFSKKVLSNAEYITHLYKPDKFSTEEQIFNEAESLIKKYSKANLVVTSRIHCALPCLAIETPVIYTDNVEKNEVSSCRLDGLIELFNSILIKDYKIIGESINDNIDFVDYKTRVKNKTAYRKIKEELINILNKRNYHIQK